MDFLVAKDKVQALALWWLQLATSKEKEQPVLTAMHVKEDLIETADGYRLHRVPARLLNGVFEGPGLVRVNDTQRLGKTAGRAWPVEPVDGKYPDSDGIMPISVPQAVACVNPKLLQDALDMPTGPGLLLKLYGDLIEVESPETGCKAIVMSMSSPRHPDIEDNDHRQKAIAWIRAHRAEVWDEAMAATEPKDQKEFGPSR